MEYGCPVCKNRAGEGMGLQTMKHVLFLIGLVLILFWLFRRPERRNRTTERTSERMVPCARCGVYLPESESIPDGAVHYCCAEHRLAAQERTD